MIEFFYKYGMISAFIIVMLEYACFPIPSEVVLPWVGSMVAICDYSFVFIWMLCNLAGLSGCLLCYFIGSILSNKIEKENKEQNEGGGNKLMKSLVAIRDILNYMTLNDTAVR